MHTLIFTTQAEADSVNKACWENYLLALRGYGKLPSEVTDKMFHVEQTGATEFQMRVPDNQVSYVPVALQPSLVLEL